MRAARIAVCAAAVFAVTAYVAPKVFAQTDVSEADELFDRGDPKSLKRAAKKYDAAIRKDPRGVPAGVYGKRAAIYVLLKQIDAGLQWVDTVALKQYPDAPEILEYKALMLWQLGRRDEAIAIADRVAKAKHDAFQVQLLRGNYYYGRDPAKAADAFEAYLKYRPASLADGDALPRLKLGIEYLRRGDADAAEKHFEIVSKQFRRNPRWLLNANNGLCAAYTRNRKFDRAITLCERIVENPKQIDRTGAVWFNLGQAYLHMRQPRKARQAGQEFLRFQPNKAKGYVLVGDAYFEERNFEEALRYYRQAEERAGSDAGLLKRLGKVYRALGQPKLALPKLVAAAAANPDSVDLALELGETYLHPDIREDDKALAAVERLLKARPDDDRLRFIAARALYNTGKLAQAKLRYLEAHKLKPSDVRYRDGLVDTINRQAFAAHASGDLRAAERYLVDALAYDKQSPATNRNLAVIAIERGDCDRAIPYLTTLAKSRQGRVIADRLLGRAYMCSKKPDRARAYDHYAAAAKAAGGTAGRNKLLVAEIFAEWAPLIAEKDLDDAIDKLEFAQQIAGSDPLRKDAINRNLAIALYRRGWREIAKGDEARAAADFERASRDKSVLRPLERLAFDFSLALAYLGTGNAREASSLFDALAKSGKQGAILRAPYDSVGARFFAAYADYRTAELRARRSAALTFAKLQRGANGKFAQVVADLVGSAWHHVAVLEYRAGNERAAKRSLATAAKYARTKQDKTLIEHNLAVVDRPVASAFASFGANPPEALVNLGIAYDRAGDPRKAYDAWTEAKARGVRLAVLDRWIDAKRRIFGY